MQEKRNITKEHFDRRFEPASDLQIAEAERHFGYEFPKDFKAFLKKNNGCRIQMELANIYELVSGEGDVSEYHLDEIFGICDMDDLDLLTMHAEPSWLLPVAGVGGGLHFSLDLRPSNLGKIYFYSADWPPNPQVLFDPIEFNEGEFRENSDVDGFIDDYIRPYWHAADSYTELLKIYGISDDLMP